jgi:hypothetical protein
VKIICSWCGRNLGEKPPLDDPSATHTICKECLKRVIGGACKTNPNITGRYFDITRYGDGAVDFDYKGGIKGLSTLRGVINEDKVAVIAYFSISPEAQRQGLGKSWVEAVENFLRKNGATSIWAGSFPSAVGFWRKMGYTIGEKSGGLYRITKKLNKSNPVPPMVQDLYDQWLVEEDKERAEMWRLLRGYEALAKAGTRYPTHRVNILFNELKRRLLWAWDHRWYRDAAENDGESPIRDLVDGFQGAESRIDKVLAIDALMHEQHFNGLVFVALFRTNHFDPLQNQDDGEVRAFLEELFRRRNPLRRRRW